MVTCKEVFENNESLKDSLISYQLNVAIDWKKSKKWYIVYCVHARLCCLNPI